MHSRTEQGAKLGLLAGGLFMSFKMLTDSSVKNHPELVPLFILGYLLTTGGGYLLGSAAGYLYGEGEMVYHNFFKPPSNNYEDNNEDLTDYKSLNSSSS